jgi:hypothetical protein
MPRSSTYVQKPEDADPVQSAVKMPEKTRFQFTVDRVYTISNLRSERESESKKYQLKITPNTEIQDQENGDEFIFHSSKPEAM